MQYADLIAHNCESVHVPGVAWPVWVDVKKFRRKDYGCTQKTILAFLKLGGIHSSLDVNAAVGGSINSARTCLLMLVKKGQIDMHRSGDKNYKGRRVNLYTAKDKCKLH